MPFDPTTSDLVSLRNAIAQKNVSSTEATQAYLGRIARLNPTLNAYREVLEGKALARAARVDAGEVRGPLAGVPIAIKDCMCYAEGTTSAGSNMLKGYRSPFTATAVKKLEEAGAVILGTTNMDEFAMGSSTETCAYGKVLNPWDNTRVPGGSSGGASATMASDMAAAALGSDTGGSIRQPAAITGTVGLKPTYGRVSRWGLIAFASSLDQIGTFTRTVGDAALLSKIMFGADPLDGTTAQVAVPADLEQVDAPVGKLRIGVAKQFTQEGANEPAVQRAYEEALAVYKAAGAEIVEVDLPHTKYGIPCYYLVATAEASSNLARYTGMHYGHRTKDADDLADFYRKSRAEGFGAEVKRRIMLGTYALSSGYYDAYYTRALKVRRLIRNDFEQAFAACDVILCPTTTGPAFKIGEKTGDPLTMYMNDAYTVTANLAGLPGISIPAGFAEEGGKKLPVGVQLIGQAFDEARLLRVARIHERATGYGLVRPSINEP